jgi:hypothetical protein
MFLKIRPVWGPANLRNLRTKVDFFCLCLGMAKYCTQRFSWSTVIIGNAALVNVKDPNYPPLPPPVLTPPRPPHSYPTPSRPNHSVDINQTIAACNSPARVGINHGFSAGSVNPNQTNKMTQWHLPVFIGGLGSTVASKLSVEAPGEV